MLLGIDHLVLAVDDPDAAATLLEEQLGLAAGGGGRHEELGTFNRLVWLGDSFLELIGLFDRGLAAASWLGPAVLAALERGGGLATWAAAVDDLDGHLRWAPESAALAGPIDGERHRPDGRIVRWRLAHPPQLSPASPFLIEHDSGAAEWTPEERAARDAEQHPVGGRVRLAGLEVRLPAPAPAAGAIRTMLGTSVEPGGRSAIRVVVGSHVVRLAAADESLPAATVELDVDAPARRRPARIGDTEVRVRGVRPVPAG